MNLYNTLGVARDASPHAIKGAYRSLAQKNHPDKEQGDHAKMQAIQAAYDVLGDAARRERYDETGETTEAPDEHPLAVGLLASLVQGLLDFLCSTETPIESADILRELRGKLNANLAAGVAVQRAVTKVITMRIEALKRLSRKQDGGTDVLKMILEGQITSLHAQMAENEAKLDVARAALNLLVNYSYEVAEKKSKAPAWIDIEFSR